MIRGTLVRSGLQLLGLCVLALFLSTTAVHAEEHTCEEQLAECGSHCGTTVNYEVTGGWWDNCQHYSGTGCVAGWSPIYNATWGNGIENWECLPHDGGNGICQCAY